MRICAKLKISATYLGYFSRGGAVLITPMASDKKTGEFLTKQQKSSVTAERWRKSHNLVNHCNMTQPAGA